MLRRFCIEKRTNILMLSEEMMQQEDQIRQLLYRLLDYRIIHNAGTALTHKSAAGTYQAFAIDIGCYAHMRKLHGRFNEIDVSDDPYTSAYCADPRVGFVFLFTLCMGAPGNRSSIYIGGNYRLA